MAELDTLRSYLISLGFGVDVASYRKMNQLLDQQKKMVMNSTGVMSNSYVQAGKTIAAVLIGVGAATVTLMDKVAKADLGYDLFGMKMYMTADAAKKVKIAVDALGYSMDEIAWNPELKKRFDQLIELQGSLQNKLGPDYKKTMREIRDIRFEFTKMRVEGEYMMQLLTAKLFKEFGIKAEDVHKVLEKISNWMENTAIPAIVKFSAEISEMARIISPIATDAFKDLNKSLNDFASVLSSGESDRATFSDWIGAEVYELSVFLRSLSLVIEGIAGLGEAAKGLYHGDLGEMKKGLSRFWGAATTKKDDLGDRGNRMLQDAADKAAGKRKPNRGASGSWDSVGGSGSWGPDAGTKVSPGVSKFKDYLSQFFPGQEHVAAAIMKAESGGDPNAHNRAGGGTGAYGLFQIRGQLHEQALKNAGIIKQQSDLFDPKTNFQAARFLYDRGGWQPWEASKKNWQGALTSNTTNNVTVNVTQTEASAEDIARAVQRKQEDLEQRRRAREIREFSGVMG